MGPLFVQSRLDDGEKQRGAWEKMEQLAQQGYKVALYKTLTEILTFSAIVLFWVSI